MKRIVLGFVFLAFVLIPLHSFAEEKATPTAAAATGTTGTTGAVIAPAPTDGASMSAAASVAPSASVPPKVSATPFDYDHIQIETDLEKWAKMSDEEGIRTYREKHSENGVVAFRGETIMPVKMTRILAVLKDEKGREEWIDALAESRIVERIGNFESVEYNHTKVPWPFHDRDFVYRVKVKVMKGGEKAVLITMSSTTSDQLPEKSGLVRGEILHSFYYLKEIPGAEPQTSVLIEMAVDPRGAIPMWLVNLTQKKWPHNTLAGIKKVAARQNLVVPKDLEDYFSAGETGPKN